MRLLFHIAWLLVGLAGIAEAQTGSPPPLGKLIDVGGYRVHLYCIGDGKPTVFIAGGFSVDWALVQPSVAKWARVCTYDVSGTAWSDPGPSLTCLDRVHEVHKLVENARIERPFVFVGFSIGALLAREYASLYPSELAGIVMVDHAFLPPEPPPLKPPAPLRPGEDSPPVPIKTAPIELTVEDSSDFAKLPKRFQELHRWAASSRPVLPTAETAKNCIAQLKNTPPAAHPLGNLPLVVIRTANDTPGYDELQRELLALSSNSKRLLAERSFHSIEIDQPEIVIEGIREVLVKISQAGTR